MSTKPEPQATQKDAGQDLATFERLPEETKDLMKLKDQDERATGPEQVEIAKQIQDKVCKPPGKTPPPDETKTDPPDDAAASNHPARPKSGAGKGA